MTKKNIILLPGLGYTKSVWKRLLEYIPKSKYNCYAFDVPPYGSTYNGKALNFKTYQDWLEDTLEKENITPPFTLVGHSLGGFISLEYSIRYPNNVSNLVTVSTPLRNANSGYPTIYKVLIWLGIHCSIARNIVRLLCKRNSSIIYKLTHLFSLARPNFLVKSDIKSVATCCRDFLNHNWENEAHKISVPNLIVYGSKDSSVTKTNGDEFFSVVKNRKIIAFPCDHSVPVRYPKKLAREILNFIES